MNGRDRSRLASASLLAIAAILLLGCATTQPSSPSPDRADPAREVSSAERVGEWRAAPATRPWTVYRERHADSDGYEVLLVARQGKRERWRVVVESSLIGSAECANAERETEVCSAALDAPGLVTLACRRNCTTAGGQRDLDTTTQRWSWNGRQLRREDAGAERDEP